MWGPCVGRQAGRWPGRGRPSLPGKAAKGAGGPAILAEAGAAGKTGPPQPFSRLQEKGWLRYSAPILLIGATLLPPPILDPTPPPGSSLTRTPTRPDSAEDALRRELYLFALYRTLEAALLALMVFSPFGGLIGEPRDPFLAMAVAIAYLPMSLALLLATRRDHSALEIGRAHV